MRLCPSLLTRQTTEVNMANMFAVLADLCVYVLYGDQVA